MLLVLLRLCDAGRFGVSFLSLLGSFGFLGFAASSVEAFGLVCPVPGAVQGSSAATAGARRPASLPNFPGKRRVVSTPTMAHRPHVEESSGRADAGAGNAAASGPACVVDGGSMSGSERDSMHMRRALELARKGVGSTRPNPAVGCVILDKEGVVVGEGFHPRAGEPHAEVRRHCAIFCGSVHGSVHGSLHGLCDD